jgi:AMIN domain
VKDFPRNLAFPKSLSRSLLPRQSRTVLALGMLLLTAPFVLSQAKPEAEPEPLARAAAPANAGKIAAIRSFRIVQEKDGQAVEILSTQPLLPSIKAISQPARLVIDLPNARLETQQKRISVQADQISALRANQFQQDPPVVRVVVDLLTPRTFTWDAAGNRLVVHLGRNPTEASASPFQAPKVPSLTSGPPPVVTAVRAAGPLTLAGNNSGSGSTIAAGLDTTIVNLSSGGEVRVCPGTTVSMTPSQNRHNLMLSMNTGALEAHFALDASSDSVITPDFRILLVGPGEFHYAISADNQGNTCVRALPGNTASAIVTESLGDRTYQVKATDQLVFRSGQLDHVDMAVPLECGCPPPRDAPMRATNNLPMLHSNPAPTNPAASGETVHAESAPATGAPGAPPSPSVAPNELHVQVEVPFVFHATGPPPVPVEEVRALPFDSREIPTPGLSVVPLPPPANQKPKADGAPTASANRPPARGFFRKLGGFFSSLFH